MRGCGGGFDIPPILFIQLRMYPGVFRIPNVSTGANWTRRMRTPCDCQQWLEEGVRVSVFLWLKLYRGCLHRSVPLRLKASSLVSSGMGVIGMYYPYWTSIEEHRPL